MTRIFLIGYMGAGKTTLGKAFAREMSLNFIDLDWFIEERFHKTVQQLFLERGEDGFRELERKMLHAYPSLMWLSLFVVEAPRPTYPVSILTCLLLLVHSFRCLS